MKGGGENLLGRWGRMLFHILNVYFIHSYIERWKREGEGMNDRESVALCWWLYLILLSGGTMTEENLLIGEKNLNRMVSSQIKKLHFL